MASAAADGMSDKLCPILSAVATQSAGAIPEMTQANLVLSVADAYGYDHDALEVLDAADASATAACPDARTAVLAATGNPPSPKRCADAGHDRATADLRRNRPAPARFPLDLLSI